MMHRLRGRRKSVVRACALAALAMSLMVLLGWQLGIEWLKSVFPNYVTMKANTALGLGLLAGGLLCLGDEAAPVWKRRWGVTLAAAAACLGFLTLIEYLAGRNLGIDEWLVTDTEGLRRKFPAGRPAPITAVNLMLISAGQIITLGRIKRWHRSAQALLFLAFLASFQTWVGYLLGVTYNFGTAYYTQMAIHTSVAFVLIAVGTLLARPRLGAMLYFTEDTAGGALARGLITSAVFVPPLVGYLALAGHRAGLYDADFEVLLRVLGNIFFFSLLVWRNSVALHASERRTRETEAVLREAVLARDEFLSIASHEFKTPLTSLKIQAYINRKYLAEPFRGQLDDLKDKTNAFLSLTDLQIDRMSTLVERMVELSRIDRGGIQPRPEPVDLRQVIQEVLPYLTTQLPAAAPCSMRLVAESPVIGQWDRVQIEQLVAHLLSNALKYGAGQPVEIHVSQDEARARLVVRDHGIGIPREKQSMIFRRFERAVSGANISGLGLGLFFVEHIVKLHQGSVRVESEPERGATFTVELPLAPAFPTAAEPGPEIPAA